MWRCDIWMRFAPDFFPSFGNRTFDMRCLVFLYYKKRFFERFHPAVSFQRLLLQPMNASKCSLLRLLAFATMIVLPFYKAKAASDVPSPGGTPAKNQLVLTK